MNGLRIGYGITVCNEEAEIVKLIQFLKKHTRPTDLIYVQYDCINGTKGVEEFLRSASIDNSIVWQPQEFNGHFADWKNKLNDYFRDINPKIDYIFQIDADEIPSEKLIELLPIILSMNMGVDLLTVPRVNTVKGLTREYIDKWGWSVNEKGWVNWPDYQWRIYKNHPSIKWEGKVHERIVGGRVQSKLPKNTDYCLYHHKTIERQEKQNNYYDTLMS